MELEIRPGRRYALVAFERRQNDVTLRRSHSMPPARRMCASAGAARCASTPARLATSAVERNSWFSAAQI